LFWLALAMLFAVDVRAQNPVLDLEDPWWSHDVVWLAYQEKKAEEDEACIRALFEP
jgi:hypothetical protein